MPGRFVLECGIISGLEVSLPQSEWNVKDLADRHLTLVHLGNPHDLLAELRLWQEPNSEISQDTVDCLLRRYADKARDLSETRYSAVILGLDIFKNGLAYLVLRVRPDDALHRLRANLLTELERQFRSCGMREISRFMGSSNTIGPHLIKWVPHITIASSSKSLPIPNISNLPTSVELGPVRTHDDF